MSKALILGDSLFAEAVARLLEQHGFEIATALTVQDALQRVGERPPDLAIMIGETPDLCALLRVHPDLPILRANLDADDLRLIRSERINARVEDLLSAIQSLSMRR